MGSLLVRSRANAVKYIFHFISNLKLFDSRSETLPELLQDVAGFIQFRLLFFVFVVAPAAVSTASNSLVT